MAQHSPLTTHPNTPNRPRITWLDVGEYIAFAAVFAIDVHNLITEFQKGELIIAIIDTVFAGLVLALLILMLNRDLRPILRARKIRRLQAKHPVTWKKRASL